MKICQYSNYNDFDFAEHYTKIQTNIREAPILFYEFLVVER